MKKYVVAFMTFFENVMKQDIFEATEGRFAMMLMMKKQGWDIGHFTSDSTDEDIMRFAFDSDCVIGYIEII